jgi:hypothetical protein
VEDAERSGDTRILIERLTKNPHYTQNARNRGSECNGLFKAIEFRRPAAHSSWAKLAGVMRQIDQPPPNLFQSDLPRFGSKGWVPRNYRQRVGAFVFGLTFVLGGLLAIASTVLLKTELAADLHSKAAAVVLSFFLVCLILVGSVIVIALGVRLLKGAFRTSAKHR